MHKTRRILFLRKVCNIATVLGLLSILITLPAIAFSYDLKYPPKLDKHLVVYGSIKDKHLEYIARNFKVLVTNSSTFGQVQKIKRLNPDITVLMYKDLFGMHPYYEDWADVNRHEDYFLHDKLLGLRLRESYFGWYVMDIAQKGWVRHFAEFAVRKLDALKAFDGIFADDVWKELYLYRFYVDIKDEECVVNPDGKIVVKYLLWKPIVGGMANNIRIRIANDKEGIDCYKKGSHEGRTISPGTPLLPGTKVYVDYSASDPEFIRPEEDKITNWHYNMVNMLNEVKARLGKKLLIINSDELSGLLLGIADGMMAEGFALTELKGWEDQVQALDIAAKTRKYYLAQIKIENGGGFTKHMDNVNRINFSLASFMIAKGTLSSFSIGIKAHSTLFFEDEALKQYISAFDKISARLGKAVSGFYVYAEGKGGTESTKENLIMNGSFEEGLTYWIITQRCLETPKLSAESFSGEYSIHFLSDTQCGSTLMSDFVPIRPGTMYELGASAKGRDVAAGDAPWKKLSLIGRFFDIDRKQIPDGIADLQFDTGSYEWKNYRKTYLSPPNAYFFRITSLGLYPTAIGKGWIGRVFLRRKDRIGDFKVYARDFERGIVLVNPSKGKTSLVLGSPYQDFENRVQNVVEMNQNSAAILFK